VTEHAGCFRNALAIVALLNQFSKTVPKEDEGKIMLRFTNTGVSDDDKIVFFAAQGKISRSPYFQLYIAHRVALAPPEGVVDGNMTHPLYTASAAQRPCTLEVSEIMEGPMKGYLAYAPSFRVGSRLAALSDHWDCHKVGHSCADGECVELFLQPEVHIGNSKDFVAKPTVGKKSAEDLDEIQAAFEELKKAKKAKPASASGSNLDKSDKAAKGNLGKSEKGAAAAVATLKKAFNDLFILEEDMDAAMLDALKAESEWHDMIDHAMEPIAKAVAKPAVAKPKRAVAQPKPAVAAKPKVAAEPPRPVVLAPMPPTEDVPEDKPTFERSFKLNEAGEKLWLTPKGRRYMMRGLLDYLTERGDKIGTWGRPVRGLEYSFGLCVKVTCERHGNKCQRTASADTRLYPRQFPASSWDT
jgi:hypothetical protein